MELTACEERLAYIKKRVPGQCKGLHFFFWSPDGVCCSVQISEKAGLCFLPLSIVI